MFRNQRALGRYLKGAKTLALATSALCAVAITSTAMAAPIGNASFGIGGGFTLPAGSNLGNTNSIFITNGGMITVFAGDTMDLSAFVHVGDTGTLHDLPSISGFTPITGFLTLNDGVSVDLESLHIGFQTGPAPGFINLYGNAVVHAPGYDPTSGSLTLSGTSSDNRSFTLAVTTSASSPPRGVPEPGSLALFGASLLGLLVLARRRLGWHAQN